MAWVDDLAAFTDALGLENAPTTVHLALVPWPTPDVRDEFILKLTGKDPRFDDAY